MESDFSSVKADRTVTPLSNNLALTPLGQPVFVCDGSNSEFKYITNGVTKRIALCPVIPQNVGYIDNVDIQFDPDFKDTGIAVNSTRTGRIQNNSGNVQNVFNQTGNYLPDTRQINSLKTMYSSGLPSHSDNNNQFRQEKLPFCETIPVSQMVQVGQHLASNVTVFKTSVASEMQLHTSKKTKTVDKFEDIKPRSDISTQPSSRPKSANKPYVCAYCDVRFKLKCSLKIHERIHTGEKPYICDVCGARFRHSPTLKEHLKMHTGEKPFACCFCQAKFTRKQSLLLHERIHTGEKTHYCSLCDAKFKLSDNLKCHMKRHGHVKGGHLVCPFCDMTFKSNHVFARHKREHFTA